ncbi:putative ATP binding protein [Hibiscus syriacus]|uniref:ATP binding protein n=1 Tax=Hibiscus syriacus TaxID=106335 RepID=A0A6A3D0T3_HIBSY|nr:putative ATP binding protein [Hibiscus syriacus]
MKNGWDFLNLLHYDLSIKILTSLQDPSDLVRFGAVSRSWQHFVIKNGLCKQLCLRMFPQLSRVDHVNELSSASKGHAEAGYSNFMECISEAIIASSTDNYPEESIDNTLESRDRVARRASYWSSKGQSNPAVPETLTYRLCADLCVITEINIRPFQAYFEFGKPIYSANSVRFRMGHMKSYVDNLVSESCQDCGHEKFVWTCTSEEFPMAQENKLQNFKLPEPVLCIGGMLQIELLGRVQREDMDGLYYICVSHVEVKGRPLSPAFGIQILEPSENFMLEARSYTQPPPIPEQESLPSTLQMRVRDLEQIVNLLRENGGEYGYGWDIEDEESDEDEEEDIDIE